MSLTEHRTQIYLTAGQYVAAKKLAARRGLSLAGVIREALTEYLAVAEEEGGAANWVGDPLTGLVGACELPPVPPDEEDLDEAIDRSVYDEV